MKNAEEIWEQILEGAAPLLPNQTVDIWLKSCSPLRMEDDRLVLDAGNSFVAKKVKESFLATLESVMQRKGKGSGIDLVYDSKPVGAEEALPSPQPHSPIGSNGLNRQYDFTSFVVGKSNRLAHAASLAVAESPGEAYNPLFIWGGVGLGKTHLMHAIGNYAQGKNGNTKVTYLSSEKFTNELINALREGKNNEFRLKYRGADLFLVDDIQFIAGKDSTQEEFFHTFNNLYESHKQIVLTSDRPPHEMVRLEDRLRTRFEWGLLADIQPPDYETRMAIIKNKAVHLGFDIPDDVCNYIAENITNNVRQIEGTVKKIKAFKELDGMVLDVPNVSRAIKDMFKGKAENLPTPALIVSEVCQYYNIEEQVLRSTLKNKNTAEARQVAMYLIRTMTNLSLPEIGREFARDHTTVMHGLKKVEQTLQNSASPLNDTIRDITANINNKL